jgi:hypothetical protein
MTITAFLLEESTDCFAAADDMIEHGKSERSSENTRTSYQELSND